ncbi:MAG: hypothetical protein QM621_09840 [Aeromicrobium sp.]|uniref:hypothetical protein n=1 Tax=Aeromicrobium sp. TaxID=1871063 RepID=UPI0039E21592
MDYWTRSISARLTEGWEEALVTRRLTRDHRVDVEWLNLATGVSIVLVADSGVDYRRVSASMRPAKAFDRPAQLRVFQRALNWQVFEITRAILGTAGLIADPSPTVATFERAQEVCVPLVERALGGDLGGRHRGR